MTSNGDSASRSGAPAVAARTGFTDGGEDRPAATGDDTLPDALTGLRAAIGAARFPLVLPSAEPAGRIGAALADHR
ncbi:ABC transporter, partial [Micromonospora sp. NPDC051296]